MKNLSSKFFLVFVLFIFSKGFSQEVTKLKLRNFKVATLPKEVEETSGLTFFNQQLLTINDSGNDSEVFQIDLTSGGIKKVYITKLKNIDWEAITSDATNGYIGDFGNNDGSRKDLKIYKIPFSQDPIMMDSIKAYAFSYPDQEDFTSKYLKNNFDAEAMIFYNNEINIFSKSWENKIVRRYRVSLDMNEAQVAEKLETFQLPYVVTDAAYYQNKLYLVGYTKGTQVYLSIFNEDEKGLFFNQAPKTYKLGSALQIGQIEGIAASEKGLFLSNELFNYKVAKVKQSLYFIPFENLE